MTEPLRPDLGILGAGPAGLALAMAAVQARASVVLVERGRPGGINLHAGAVHSRALFTAADATQNLRTANALGISTNGFSVDFGAVRRYLQSVVADMSPAFSDQRLRALGIQLIRAQGRFTARHRVAAGDVAIEARRFVVASGASPVIPSIPGIETIPVLTSDTIFDLDAMPRHLIVYGDAPYGAELAQAFRRLGSAVTLLVPQVLLPMEDPELADIVAAALRSEGLRLRENARPVRIDPLGNGLRLFLDGDDQPVEGSHLLVALPRRPNVVGLGLHAARVAFSSSGITVGRDLRTRNWRVYAMGDVTGAPASMQAAEHHAALLFRIIVRRQLIRAGTIGPPRLVLTDPEIATAGLTEADACDIGLRILTHRWPFSENDRARTGRQRRGHVKVVTSRGGRVLGAGIVGPGAGEMIGLWQMAVNRKMLISELASLELPYPTLSAVSRDAALQCCAERTGGLKGRGWFGPARPPG